MAERFIFRKNLQELIVRITIFLVMAGTLVFSIFMMWKDWVTKGSGLSESICTTFLLVLFIIFLAKKIFFEELWCYPARNWLWSGSD